MKCSRELKTNLRFCKRHCTNFISVKFAKFLLEINQNNPKIRYETIKHARN